MMMSFAGRSPPGLTVIRSIRSSTSSPPTSLPNTVCLPLRCGVSRKVMKNWEVLDRGPLFAMDCGWSARSALALADTLRLVTHYHTPRVMLVRPLLAVLIPERLAPERLSAPPRARRITSLDLSPASDMARQGQQVQVHEINPP